MNSKTTAWIGIACALTGLALLTAWAYSMVTYGYWLDEHGAVGKARASDYVLFWGGAALFIAAGAIALKQRSRSKNAESPGTEPGHSA